MKQVKFNLYVDAVKIRTIDELKEHFNIDDLLEWYNNGVLQKWLAVRHYDAFLSAVEAIQYEDQVELATKLIAAFGISEAQSKMALDSLQYRMRYANQFVQRQENSHQLIQAYMSRYEDIKKMLLQEVK